MRNVRRDPPPRHKHFRSALYPFCGLRVFPTKLKGVRTLLRKCSSIRTPLPLRASSYTKALELRAAHGWGYKRISRFLNMPRPTVQNWIRGKHSPFGSCKRPDLKPSLHLSYLAGAFLGDGGLITSTPYHYELRFRVKDRDFAERYSASLSSILAKSIPARAAERDFFCCQGQEPAAIQLPF